MNFDLGPYGDFIWPAYAVSILSLLAASVLTLIAWRKAKARLERLERK
jgi:heme exporter protein CcmD